jgi:hypothetical protein
MFRKFGLLISLSFIVLNPNYVNAEPDFFCYMIDPDGFVFDLGALCGQIPSTLNLSGKYVGLHPTLEVSNSSTSNSRTPNANGNGIRIINLTPGSASGIITPSYSGSYGGSGGSGSSGSSGGSGSSGSSGSGSSGSGSSGSGSSGSGRCNKPTDIASDGSRCGKRAASER